MGEHYIKKTQDSLGKIIKKPPLTEKLLSKPPFRFLHDIMTSVIKTTGFMKGLFDETEMQSDNVKERDSKIAFLQKAIDIVSLVIGETISARPSKIVAGQEADKTNEFLKLLAAAIKKKPDNDSVVKQVLSSNKSKSDSNNKEKRERSASKSKDEERKHREKKDKEKSKEDQEVEKPEKEERKHRNKDKHRERDRSKEKGGRDRSKENGNRDEKQSQNKEDRHRSSRKNESHDTEIEQQKASGDAKEIQNGTAYAEDDDASNRPIRPTSAKGRRRPRNGKKRKDDDDDDREVNNDTRQYRSGVDGDGLEINESTIVPQATSKGPMARPGSARPGAPRPKQKENAPPAEDNQHLMSGKVPNVIVDKADDSDDDFVAKEEDNIEQPLVNDLNTLSAKNKQADSDSDDDHGGLVKKILETKKEQEDAIAKRSGVGKVTVERSLQPDATRRKQRELIQKEMDALRQSIQTLTRSANPLGKMMDYIQEDLDSMQKEIVNWKEENEKNTRELQMEQVRTDDVLEPLKAQLNNVDQRITDQLDLIAATKSSILRNDERIHKMLSSITKS